MDAPRSARLREFLQRLSFAEPAGDAAAALALLAELLNAVEDEMTSIPYSPSRTDGRMYPPQPDSARTEGEAEGITRYRSAHHNTWIGEDGAIRIDEVKGPCVINKPGRSGNLIVVRAKR
jgi:hypothetical protein